MGWLQYLHRRPPEHIRLPPKLASQQVEPSDLNEPDTEIVDHAAAIGAAWVDTMVEIAGLSAKRRILDVGCGPGRTAIAIGERFEWANDYLGIDARKTDIRFARRSIERYYPSFRFEHVNAHRSLNNASETTRPEIAAFPVGNFGVDYVIAIGLFTHTFTSETTHYLNESARVLAPGGVLFATFYCLHETGATNPPRLTFGHQRDCGCFVASPEHPKREVAFHLYRLMDMIAVAGFGHIEHHQGSWAGVPGRHSQDIVIARI